jgi:CHASE3 domain sensor protein
MPKLTNEIITAAIAGYESQKARIDQQIAELRAMLKGGPAKTTTLEITSPKRRKFSAAARRRMAEAQRARWAKIKGESKSLAPAKAPAKTKRKISAAGRRAMAEASRKRWAAVKAGKGKS